MRATHGLAIRLPAFAKKIKKIHALRKTGINATQIVRAAGTPAVTYGVATCGMADTPLKRTRGTIARAAAPEGAGKNPDIVLWAVDGGSGTLDPGFDAHVQPISFWAHAWWQKWRPRARLIAAADSACAKFNPDDENSWKNIAGPVLALIATMHRIGWTMRTPYTLVTDRGHVFHLEQDPPAAVAAAAKAGQKMAMDAHL